MEENMQQPLVNDVGFQRPESPARWLVLVLACVLMLGSYYSYDIPSVTKDNFKAHYNITDFNYNLVTSVYSFPNIVLPFFGGFFVDKLGTKVTLVTFSSLIALGQAVFSVAAMLKSFPLALVGRVIFGLGGESLGVGQSTVLSLWFKHERALAMGVNLSFSRLGSVVNDYVSPPVTGSWGLAAAMWIGCCLCIVSVLAAVGLIFMEWFAEKRTKIDAETVNENTPLTAPEPEEEMRLGDLRYFQLSFWLITLSCVTVYSAILPFNSNAESLLTHKYNYSDDAAGRLLSIPFFISAGASPFLGFGVDRFGYRPLLVTIAAGVLGGAHCLMAFTELHPAVPLVFVGMAYSVYAAALWPSVPLVVKKHQIGTAYGVVTACQNGGLAVVPLIVGAITDAANQDYKYSEMFFAGMALLGVVVGVFLLTVDARRGGILSMPGGRAADAAQDYFARQQNESNQVVSVGAPAIQNYAN